MFIEIAIAAFILGITSSLHCVGMCGPLLLSIPWHSSKKKLEIGIYHLGRLLTYGILGGIVGFLGEQIFPKNLGSWPATISGFILVFIFIIQSLPRNKKANNFYFKTFQNLFKKQISSSTPWSRFLLGMINGILPCGMVYLALAMASHYHGSVQGFTFMFLFGLATSPLLVFLQSIKALLGKLSFFQRERTIRFAFLILGLLFILRGANLGIPFFSPKTSEKSCCSTHSSEASCH
jgi:sulfite exporter TauE/SafE